MLQCCCPVILSCCAARDVSCCAVSICVQRKDSNFGLILAAAFLLPAAVILAVAYGSGYMDSLYTNTMSNYSTR